MKSRKYVKPLAALCALHLISLALFHNITAFAPDETNYLSIFKILYRSDFSMLNLAGWPPGSENVVRILYFPAKILNLVGVSELLSIRIQAVGYTISAALMLYIMASDTSFLGFSSRKWITFSLLIPSVFLWGSLGLRENLIQFFLVGSIYTITNFLRTNSKKYLVVLMLLSIGLYITKGYLFIILFLSIIMACVFLTIKSRKVELGYYLIVISLLIPLALFPSITKSNFESARYFTSVATQSSIETNLPGEVVINSFDEFKATGQTSQDLLLQIKNNPIFFFLASKIGLFNALKRTSEIPPGASNEEAIERHDARMNFKAAKVGEPLGVLFGSGRFLFTPIPFVDSGSFFLNILAVESFAWYAIYLFYILLIGKLIFRGREIGFPLVSLIFFTIFFVVISALIEVNTGTSIRHRSILLFCILITIGSARVHEGKHANK